MEMMVLIDVLQQIRNNHTHKTFVAQLRPALDDMTEAVRDLLREIRGADMRATITIDVHNNFTHLYFDF